MDLHPIQVREGGGGGGGNILSHFNFLINYRLKGF